MKYIIILLCLGMFGCNGNRLNIDKSSIFNTICLDNHVYYDSGYRLAIKLNDDGKPIKCKEIVNVY